MSQNHWLSLICMQLSAFSLILGARIIDLYATVIDFIAFEGPLATFVDIGRSDDDIWWYMVIYGDMVMHGYIWWRLMLYEDIWWCKRCLACRKWNRVARDDDLGWCLGWCKRCLGCRKCDRAARNDGLGWEFFRMQSPRGTGDNELGFRVNLLRSLTYNSCR